MTTRGLAQLASDQLVFTVSDPEFSPLAASILRNHLTESDGWAEAINAAALPLAQEADALLPLGSDLLEANFPVGEFEDQALTPLAASHAQFVQAGDALFSNMADTISNDPSKAPPAGDGGGEQGGGDGGGEAGGGGGGGGGGEPILLFVCPDAGFDCLPELVEF